MNYKLLMNINLELIEYKKRKEIKTNENLIFGSDLNNSKGAKTTDIELKKDKDQGKLFGHVPPKFWIQLIHDETSYNPSQIPPQIRKKINQH